jgi:membrane-associated HD superfamily phosphohydrolase
MTDKMTQEEVTRREAASEAASKKVTALQAELKQAERDSYEAHHDAIYAARQLSYQTRKDKFENAAREAIAEAKLRCGMSAEYPTEKLVGHVLFDVPFSYFSGDAVMCIQPHDYGKRARRYKQNKDGGFNVSAIAALFADGKPE